MHSAHLIDDTYGVTVDLHYNSDFSGYVIVNWSVAMRPDRPAADDETKLKGRELIRGNVEIAPGFGAEMPPLEVATRVVALAVETYLLGRMRSAIDDVGVPRARPTFAPNNPDAVAERDARRKS